MCGYTKPTSQVKMADVKQLLAAVWLHFIKYHPHAELDQLKKGLSETLDFKMLIVMHPNCVWKLLASSSSYDVTPSCILDSFVIQYSLQGSNIRTKEEAIIAFWYEYVMDCEGM